MVIATIIGGMGNQLRAYATAYTVARYLKKQLVLDISDYFGGYFRPYILDRLNIPNHLKIYYSNSGTLYSFLNEVQRNLRKEPYYLLNIDNIRDRRGLLEAVSGKENVYLTGYGKLSFCTEKERAELKELFQPLVKSKHQDDFMHKAEREESVAVHVRRTDFIDNEWASEETLKYYHAAISYLEQQLERLEFYIFSDDIEWTKKELGYRRNFHYVNCLGGMESDIEELFLMAACKHHVLTDQSTFGEWAVFLSLQANGINIVNGRKSDIPGALVMDKKMIADWCQEYRILYVKQTELIPWNELEKKLGENSNEKVINFVDRLSLDTYSISPDVKDRLMELKGIAHIQNGDIETALSVFDRLQQSQRDSFDFSLNYAIALKAAEHQLESLIYLGNALRIDGERVADVISMNETVNTLEESVLRLVSRQKKRHYILIEPFPAYPQNVKGYYESIAIMLRNLGNTVSIAELMDRSLIFTKKWSQDSKNAISGYMLSTAEKQDRVYNWDIIKYQVFAVEVNNRQMMTVTDFLTNLIKEDENAIFLTHSIEGIRNAASSYPLIFLDAISEWDMRKGIVNFYGDGEWNEIWQKADKVITKREPLIGESNKKVSPIEIENRRGADGICFREERIMELSHYMKNDEVLCGVLSILKAVEEMGA